MEMYILVILSFMHGAPDITTRLLEVRHEKTEFVIVRSEFDYLGKGEISAQLEEDEYGLSYFEFTSKEEEPRQFICEDSDSSDYIHGDIIEDGEEAGEFILRKVSGARLP